MNSKQAHDTILEANDINGKIKALINPIISNFYEVAKAEAKADDLFYLLSMAKEQAEALDNKLNNLESFIIKLPD